ncbi:Conserved_hypothetical protein [Hexamita inflata]|uniref:Cleavage/polyadenylation specificity factor A subunit C-terminal domain-containing protein n=1 Tax=Hexamita inflata TaxID=28002 RepID=A0ABP1GM95_9EUKA
MQIYAQTIVEGGAVLQAMTGKLSDDPEEVNLNLIVVKAMSIDIFSMNGAEYVLSTQISINKAIDMCCVIPRDRQSFQSDLLFVVSTSLDITLIQFYGPCAALRYQTIKQFNLLELLKCDSRFQIPFQKKVQPNIVCMNISEKTRAIVLTYQETPSLFQQLCFVSIYLSEDPQFNIGMVKNANNIQGLITAITIHEPLDKFYKGVRMLPQLGLFAMYLNRYFTFDLQLTEIFTEFKGIRFVNSGVVLNDGPFILQNIADFAVIQTFSSKPFFPLLIASIERIQVCYDFDRICQFTFQDKVHLSPMSRPLSICETDKNTFVITYDDGNLVLAEFNPEKNELSAKLLDHPKIDGVKLRLPTTTQIVAIPYEHKSGSRKFVYLGSQSIDSCILELNKVKMLSILQDRFQQCIGAVQDFCLLTHNRVYISTSHGRDGSILQGRLGFQMKGLCQEQINKSFKNTENEVDTRILNCFEFQNNQYIILSGDQKSQIYEYNYNKQSIKDISNDVQFKSFLKERWTKVFTFNNTVFKATKEFVEWNGQLIVIQSKDICHVHDHVVILGPNKITIFKLGEKLERVFEFNTVCIAICCYVIKNELFLTICQEQCITIAKIKNSEMELINKTTIPLNIHSISCTNMNNNIIFCAAADTDIYYSIFDNSSSKQLTFTQLLKRFCKLNTFQYDNHIFIQSSLSVYKLEISEEKVYVIPIITDPFNPILVAAPIKNMNHSEDKQLNQVNQRVQLIHYPVPLHNTKEDTLLKFNFVIISDGPVKTKNKMVQYQLAYNDKIVEDSECEINEHQIAVCQVDMALKYAMKRYLIKRTPIKIQHCTELDILGILTEQYIGKSQIRFYSENAKEFHKIILEKAVCTDLKFLVIKNKMHFVYSLFSVSDVYEQLKQMNSPALKDLEQAQLRPRLIVTLVDLEGEIPIIELKQIEFPSSSPVSVFVQFNNNILACVGTEIFVMSDSFEILQKYSFNYLIEHLLVTEQSIFCVRTGQLIKLNDKLQIIHEENNFKDIKLIQSFGNYIIALSYDNTVAVFDSELNMKVKIGLNQNVTCAKMQHNQVFMGTDTGSILVFSPQDISFLEFLQAEVVNQLENTNRNIFLGKMFNAVDGDIIGLYMLMNISDQTAIAARLNTSRETIYQTLLKVGMDIAE